MTRGAAASAMSEPSKQAITIERTEVGSGLTDTSNMPGGDPDSVSPGHPAGCRPVQLLNTTTFSAPVSEARLNTSYALSNSPISK